MLSALFMLIAGPTPAEIRLREATNIGRELPCQLPGFPRPEGDPHQLDAYESLCRSFGQYERLQPFILSAAYEHTFDGRTDWLMARTTYDASVATEAARARRKIVICHSFAGYAFVSTTCRTN